MAAHPLPPRPCAQCGKDIPTFILVDGHKRYHRGRKYCFDCNPFDSYRGRTISGALQRDAPIRTCRRCKADLSADDFHTNNRNRGYKNSYCKDCQTARIRRGRQQFKDECIAYKGGRCESCGYDRCRDALDFHHRDPSAKEFKLSKHPRKVLDQTLKDELDKCSLLCSNCHREEHADPNAFRNGATPRRCKEEACPAPAPLP